MADRLVVDEDRRPRRASVSTRRRSATLLRWTVRYRLTPWWAKVLLIFVASRVVTTLIMLGFANIQDANPWTGPKPNLYSFSAIWDSYWYYIVAVSGYPAHLPMVGAHVGQNAWAFLPGFPLVLRGFLSVGVPSDAAGVYISVIFSAGAALMFFRLMARVLPASTALFAVVLFCVGPTSPILQVGYAESMQLFFLFWALLLFESRRYYLMIPVIAAAALTRPSGLAFAVMLLIHLVYRLATRRRDPFPWSQRIAVVVTGLASAFLGVLWSIIAWIGTGSPTAYTDTELAWRADYIGYQDLVPFQPWFLGAEWWLRWVNVPSAAAAVAGPLLVLVVVGLFVGMMFLPWVRRLGVGLRLWLAGYGVYLLAVFFPQSSTFRLLMPLAPALGGLAQVRPLGWKVALVVGGIVGQIGWMAIAWWVNGYDWSPP
jgi:hypothetical protein